MDAEAIKAKAKAEAKRRAEEQKYSAFLEACKATDLSEIEKLGLVSGDVGADILGRRIVTIALGEYGGPLLKKETTRKKLLMYTILKMDAVVQGPYVLVYCHTDINLIPLFLWLRKVYGLLPRKFKKNMKQFFILHPTKWVATLAKIIKKLGVSKKLWQKVHYPQTIAELQKSLSPMPTLPKFVHDTDLVRVQKLQNADSGHAKAGNASNPAPTPPKRPLGLVFGRPLVGMSCFKSKTPLPQVLDKLADYLQQQRCSRLEGLFRIPAQQVLLNKYRAVIDKGGMPDFLGDNSTISRDVHTAAGLYKFFYRKLPEPLIPVKSYRAMIETDTKAEMDEVLAREIDAMPMEHHKCLLHLLDFLSLIAFEQGYNKMSKSNLAMVFAPSVLRDPEASPMQEMATIKGKVDILHYVLETYEINNLFDNGGVAKDTAAPAPAAAPASSASAAMPAPATIDAPPKMPARNRPKALPTGSLQRLNEQLALLSADAGGASAVAHTSDPFESIDGDDDPFDTPTHGGGGGDDDLL